MLQNWTTDTNLFMILFIFIIGIWKPVYLSFHWYTIMIVPGRNMRKVIIHVLGAKVVNQGHPWVLLQATGHMPVCSEWLKQCKMHLSIDPRGTLVVYNAPARFTYQMCLYVCRMIAGTIQMRKINHFYTHPHLLCMHPYWIISLIFY